MGKAKKNKIYFQDFESTKAQDRFTRITYNMKDSKAWQELNLRQIGLYLVFKSKYQEKRISGMLESSNENNISFPQKEIKKYYSEIRTFWIDLDKLIDLGFIRVVETRWNTRECTIYGFSKQWQYYNTSNFSVTDKDRRKKRTYSEEHKENIKKALKETNKKKKLKNTNLKLVE